MNSIIYSKGLFSSLVTKKLRFISENTVMETMIVLIFGFCSFATAEIFHFSGVISVLLTGIIMSHYLFYNISTTGKITTRYYLREKYGILWNYIYFLKNSVLFSGISVIAEASLYIYLGIIVWHLKGDPNSPESVAWSWTFLIIELSISFISRFVSIFVVSWIAIL